MPLRLQPQAPDDHETWRESLIARMVTNRVASGSHDQHGARSAAEAVVRRLLPADPPNANARVWEVSDGVTPVGSVWLDLRESGGPVVLDVALDDVSDAPEVRALVEDAVRAEGGKLLRTAVHRNDPALVAFTADAGFEPVATQMVLSLDKPPEPSAVELRPMTPTEFKEYIDDDIETYALERHTAGLGTMADMRIDARQSMDSVLPEGERTPGQHLWTAYIHDQRVGLLWISSDEPRCYVYNVVVDETQRGEGNGRAIMDAGAAWCRESGAHEMGLNVFGHNQVARALYDSLGYRVVEELVGKSLRPVSPGPCGSVRR